MSENRPKAVPAEAAARLVRQWLVRIPRGKVTTYGELAALAGMPGRARWVGRVLSHLEPDEASGPLPWHRVVAAQGRIALPEGSDARRQQCERLAAEGVATTRGRVDLGRHGWRRGNAAPVID